jgi:hypothetical protein
VDRAGEANRTTIESGYDMSKGGIQRGVSDRIGNKAFISVGVSIARWVLVVGRKAIV